MDIVVSLLFRLVGRRHLAPGALASRRLGLTVFTFIPGGRVAMSFSFIGNVTLLSQFLRWAASPRPPVILLLGHASTPFPRRGGTIRAREGRGRGIYRGLTIAGR